MYSIRSPLGISREPSLRDMLQPAEGAGQPWCSISAAGQGCPPVNSYQSVKGPGGIFELSGPYRGPAVRSGSGALRSGIPGAGLNPGMCPRPSRWPWSARVASGVVPSPAARCDSSARTVRSSRAVCPCWHHPGSRAEACFSPWCLRQGWPRLVMPVVPPSAQASRWSASLSRDGSSQPGNGHRPSRSRSQPRMLLG